MLLRESCTDIRSEDIDNKWISSLVPVYYAVDRHIVRESLNVDVFDKHKTSGLMLNLNYTPAKSWWSEISTGLEHETLATTGTFTAKASATGLDDFIMQAGHDIFLANQTQLVLYACGGLPTKRKVIEAEKFDTLVGTRFFSAGAGTELSHDFIGAPEESLIGIFQGRLVHFFSREWCPILPAGADIQPGNMTDFLLSLLYRKSQNTYEGGYNLTIFSNQAICLRPDYIAGYDIFRNSIFFSL